jgi:hypothetical protein
MSTKKLLAILVSVLSFLLGVSAQVLLDQWIAEKNILPFGIGVIIICLISIIIVLGYLEKRFDSFDYKLQHIANSIGIYAEYIEDGIDGNSYIKSKELVERAQINLIFVAQWEPFPNYLVNDVNVNKKVGTAKILDARSKFYEAVTKQAEQHRYDEKPFYSRVVRCQKII